MPKVVKKILTVIFLITSCSYARTAIVRNITQSEGYYWRDYHGVVPNDALVPGIDNNGMSVYIAQVLYEDQLIPGRLVEGQNQAVFEYGGKKWTTSINIKIFCTKVPQFFKWIKTTSAKFSVQNDYIVGGYEKRYGIFIGRGTHNWDLLIGKIVVDGTNPIVLHAAQDDVAIRLNNFEVLSFSPTLVDSNTNVIFNLPVTSNELYYTDAYYWRDFKNHIPFDAFIAGHDEKLLPIYIVQVLHTYNLLPGKLNIGKNEAVYEYANKPQKQKHNIKILCSNYPQYLKWETIDSSKISINNSVVVGGYETTQFLYIGRAVNTSELLVGKLIPSTNRQHILYSVRNNEIVKLHSYETLVFNQADDYFTTVFIETVRTITPLPFSSTTTSKMEETSEATSFLVDQHDDNELLSVPEEIIVHHFYNDTIEPTQSHAYHFWSPCEILYFVPQIVIILTAYYWRDFDNHVPFDAFSAGDDKDMLPIFIGQILDKDSLFPSTLEIEKNTYTGFVKKNNIKIICSNYPQYLELKKIDDPKMLRNNNVIVGGYEKSDFLYIGRRISKGEILSYETLVVKQIHSDSTTTTDSSLFATTTPAIAESPTPSVAPFPVHYYNGTELDSVSKQVIINHYHFYNVSDQPGYYWRDYHNRFPSDAFIAGNDIDGTPMYIAQVLYRDMLIPGKIGKNQSYVEFEYGTKKLTTSENIKILCTNFPEFFNWIDTSTYQFLTNEDYIVGGYEKDYKVYIGRGIHNGRWLIGKVIVIDLGVPIVFYTTDGEQSIMLKIFQVLRFSPISVDRAAITNVISNPPEVTNELYYTDAYYWRYYDNHIPFDAFSVGDDKDMLPTYIGQVLHKDSLFPGKLNIEEKEVTYEHASKEFVRTRNIKILCSNYPQYLEWKRISDPTMPRNNNAIVGGHEKSYFVYIGRGVSKGEILVGKLIPINGRYQLHSIQNDAAVRLQSYEALVVKQIDSNFTTTTGPK
ncbi:hypothetical protein FQA39_LY03171 [Lamprigera yunnana]|nr:hypothetical protein FQA39_LY03171 [Lamprigera yunnana]